MSDAFAVGGEIPADKPLLPPRDRSWVLHYTLDGRACPAEHQSAGPCVLCRTPSNVRGHIVHEARTWLGTPWQPQARVRGVGVDCLQLLIGVYAAVGIIPALETPAYPRGGDLRDDRYLEALAPYVDPCRTDPPQPGDLAVFRIGAHASHAGIVATWPWIVHADGISAKCVIESRADKRQLAKRFLHALTPKGIVAVGG